MNREWNESIFNELLYAYDRTVHILNCKRYQLTLDLSFIKASKLPSPNTMEPIFRGEYLPSPSAPMAGCSFSSVALRELIPFITRIFKRANWCDGCGSE